MPKLILTFDYELFLGEDSGTAKNSILEPTDKIIKLLKKYDSKAIFFVDTTFLMVLEKFKHKDLEPILEQLKEIVDIGSSVELHLHPQWLDALPNGEDRWSFKTFDRYRLHSLSKEEIEKVFSDSVDFLKKNIGVNPIVFRAGGWSITPFNRLKDAFLKNGIKIDMSVLPKFYKKELPMHYYDFLDTPQKEYYRFSDNVIKEDNNGEFLEIPVTTFYMNGYDLAINNIINKINKEKYFGDGRGLSSSNVRGNIIKRLFKKNLRKATIENQSFYMFKKSLNKIEKRELLSYVMHPKTLSDTSLKNFEYLVKNYKTLSSQDILKEYF